MLNFWRVGGGRGTGRKEIKTYALLSIQTEDELTDKSIYEICIYCVSDDTLKSSSTSTTEMSSSVPSTSSSIGRTDMPRIIHKLNMLFSPSNCKNLGKAALPLKADVLKKECNGFNRAAANAIVNFLDSQMKPVCLVAQNGQNYVFPLLKRTMKGTCGVNMTRDLLCYDTTDFLKEKTAPTVDIQNPEIPGGSYRIEGVYQKIFGTENEPTIDRAETSVNMLLRILMNLGDEFITASKKQSTYFKDVYMGR
ncbi:TREX2 family protein [Megaselia abdita]